MARESWKPGNMLYPLPAVMVSCQKQGENPNIITIAWTGTACTDPPMLYVSIRKERYSYDIIKDTGEFVINLVGEKQVKEMDWCGVKSGRDFNKFKETGLTPIPSIKVNVPSIKECPVSIECKVDRIVELGSHDMFLANVVGVTVASEYLDNNGRFCMEKANMISYLHGQYYGLGEYFGKFGYSIEKKK